MTIYKRVIRSLYKELTSAERRKPVNTSGERNRRGAGIELATVELIQHIVDKCPNLNFKGVLTIGASNRDTDHEKANLDFVRLKETREMVAEEMNMSEQSLELPMGMSHDYEEAVRMGSTNVRVGSSIFGARDKGWTGAW